MGGVGLIAIIIVIIITVIIIVTIAVVGDGGAITMAVPIDAPLRTALVSSVPAMSALCLGGGVPAARHEIAVAAITAIFAALVGFTFIIVPVTFQLLLLLLWMVVLMVVGEDHGSICLQHSELSTHALLPAIELAHPLLFPLSPQQLSSTTRSRRLSF